MDLSNFDFNLLNQNALDQTLAQLASPAAFEPWDENWNTYQIPGFDADATSPHER